jgi:hypothetical protein
MRLGTPRDAAREAIANEVAKLAIDVLDVRLEGPSVVVEFAADEHPGCRFGFRFPARAADDPDETLEGHAALARVNLQEEIKADDHGLPDDCRPGTLAWLDS